MTYTQVLQNERRISIMQSRKQASRTDHNAHRFTPSLPSHSVSTTSPSVQTLIVVCPSLLLRYYLSVVEQVP